MGARWHVGNAEMDSVASSGWFLGQFVPPELGLRHQTDLELKWGIHKQGERRPGGHQANGAATTISILITGIFRTIFHDQGKQQDILLSKSGDYIVFGPDLVHGWEAVSDAVVLSVRFPSVDIASSAKPRSAAGPHQGG
jgi:hypothetical protein